MKKPGENDEEILVSMDTDSEAGMVKSPSSSGSEKSSDQLSLPAASSVEHLNLPVNILSPTSPNIMSTTPSISSRRTSTSSTSLPNKIGNTGRSGAEEVRAEMEKEDEETFFCKHFFCQKLKVRFCYKWI